MIVFYMFQFPLHRDPRCNFQAALEYAGDNRFSSLYIGILAATFFPAYPALQEERFSSLYIGILAATWFPVVV